MRKNNPEERITGNITQEEVSKAIDQLQNYRAPGQDGVIGEILKTGGDKIREVVWMLCCVVWRAEEVPNEWGRV